MALVPFSWNFLRELYEYIFKFLYYICDNQTCILPVIFFLILKLNNKMYENCFPDVDIWETPYNFRFWVFIPFEAKSICSETRGCRKRFIPAGTGSKVWGIQSQNTGWHRAQGERYIYCMLFVVLSYFFDKTRFNEITSGVTVIVGSSKWHNNQQDRTKHKWCNGVVSRPFFLDQHPGEVCRDHRNHGSGCCHGAVLLPDQLLQLSDHMGRETDGHS